MSFQFQCPHGHLLEGDPSQAGQQCNCPTCGVLFIIPAPLAPELYPQSGAPTESFQLGPATGAAGRPPFGGSGPAPAASVSAPGSFPPSTPYQAAPTQPAAGPPFALSPHAADAPGTPAAGTGTPEAVVPDAGGPQVNTAGPAVTTEPEVPAEPDLLHIPCPNGHELETPRDMLAQEVLCPYCNVQFRLREKDSVEYKRKRKDDLERKERRQSVAWFNWAIVAAVLVILLIVFLIFSSSG
jgi:hypothetical protein